jgi:hypothetical protein
MGGTSFSERKSGKYRQDHHPLLSLLEDVGCLMFCSHRKAHAFLVTCGKRHTLLQSLTRACCSQTRNRFMYDRQLYTIYFEEMQPNEIWPNLVIWEGTSFVRLPPPTHQDKIVPNRSVCLSFGLGFSSGLFSFCGVLFLNIPLRWIAYFVIHFHTAADILVRPMNFTPYFIWVFTMMHEVT